LRRSLVLSVTIAIFAFSFGETAMGANCAPLEMRLMQLQARGDASSSEAKEVRGLLQACQGNAPGGFSGWHSNREEGGVRRETVSSTIRTLCVRSCDGYYFPISYSTTRDRLEADEEACRRQCPAGDASIYYHASRGQIADQAVSISGSPYSSLENAFRYRSVLDQSCTCGTPIPDPREEAMLRSFPSVPEARRDPGEDPETLLNRQGRLSYPEPVAEIQYPIVTASAAPRAIRVIFAEGNKAQEELVISEVPNARFRPEEGPFLHRGPGDIECIGSGAACFTR
jgi:hypothetical protein